MSTVGKTFVLKGTLPTPGLLGRTIRLTFGVAILAWLVPSLIGSLPDLLKLTRVPTNADSIGFWIAVVLAFANFNYVVNLGLGKSWGRKPQLIFLFLLGAAVLLDLLWYGQFWAFPLSLTLFVCLMVIYLPLGVAFVLATVLGTPGCEMRSYAHLSAKLSGREAAEHFCPGGVDFADAWGRRQKH